MPKTVKAKLLLGWMPEQEAMKQLNNCVFDPALSNAQKKGLWQGYVARTQAIKREAVVPDRKRYTLAEKMEINRFLKKMGKQPDGHRFRQVLKLDPSQLVIHQFFVVTERSEQHGKAMLDDRARINYCLGVGLEERHKIKEEPGPNGTVIVKLPHFEFLVWRQNNGTIEISEMGRWMTIYPVQQRLLLWSGYHRAYALFTQMTPEADGMAPLLTLMRDLPEAEAFLGSASDRAFVRDEVLGTNPPLFSDFFNAELFIEVDLLSQRREVHIEPTTRNFKDLFVPE